MKNHVYQIVILFCAFVMCKNVTAQEFNYNRISVQGQLINSTLDEADFEFLIISLTGDTLWRESHTAIPLYSQGAFTLPFGAGDYISGDVANFHNINWLTVDRVELYHIGTSRYLQGAFNAKSVPYSLHSLTLTQPISTTLLMDISDTEYEIGDVIEYNGTNFSVVNVYIGDTAMFSWESEHSFYADTVNFAYNHDFADSALYSYHADSSSFANFLNHVLNVDNAHFADSVNYTSYSSGNWSITGDVDLADESFVGSISDEAFVIRTNNTPRLIFDSDFSTHNDFEGDGFRIRANDGFLVVPNSNPGISEIEGSFFYFDAATTSLHGGSRLGDFDTLKGEYSFAWGNNVGTNGTYSTVFGQNTFGDTALFGGLLVPYASISSFAAGKDCHVAHMGFAFGDSAIANYYRNFAIGKNVTSNIASAGLGIGNNILVEGATAWAVGRNLTANGHFSTVLGSNASSDSKIGGFVYGDNSTSDTVKNTVNHQFVVRADGGVVFYSNADLSMGVELVHGAGSWSMISDRNKKYNIELLAPLNFSAEIDSLSVQSWNYLGHVENHVGPIAQDFYEIFKLGSRSNLINMIDSDGVTFLGIKKINQSLNAQPTSGEVMEVESELEKEKAKLDEIEQRINQLYEELDHN